MQHRVTIGLPCYNRPELLRIAVASLLAQTHRDVDIFISDNASSSPSMASTLHDLAASDSRVRYRVNQSNIGPAANFKAVCSGVESPYFMWASDDDVWDRYFVERCLELLSRFPEAQMAAGSIDNINNSGSRIRTYSGFSRFASTGDCRADATRFVSEPEILGKANLIYGLFRTSALHSVVNDCWDEAGFDLWGGDCVFMFTFLSRYPIAAVDDVLLHKRIPTDCVDPIKLRDPRTYLIPPLEMASFLRRLQRVAPDRGGANALFLTFFRKILSQYSASLQCGAFWEWSRYKRIWTRSN